MARAQSTDYLHGMRFQVDVVGVGPSKSNSETNFLGVSGSAPAGFSSVTTPDLQVNVSMYKEGTWIYERKYPGEPSMGGDLQMDRGVARGDSSFWAWLRVVVEGSGEYRTDLDIKHFHREQALTRPVNDKGGINNLKIETGKPARVYHVFEAFPIQHNVLSNSLSGTDGDISIMSITVAYEHFEVQEMTAL